MDRVCGRLLKGRIETKTIAIIRLALRQGRSAKALARVWHIGVREEIAEPLVCGTNFSAIARAPALVRRVLALREIIGKCLKGLVEHTGSGVLDDRTFD